jgi:L-2-hydroxycarboxylate dehydrogenase (NAD+)
MIDKTIYLPVTIVQNFMYETLLKSGVPTKDALICAEVLIASDLRGIESHGIGRLRMYYDRLKKGLQSPVTKMIIERESPTTAVIDGNDGMGMVIGVKSMQMAIDKAQQYGMGSVAVRNSTHFGIDGYYALMAVKTGMIGMSFTNARPCVSPTFGTQPTLGTNPIAFGAPTDEECPFLFDAATSITQRGKIEVLSREEKQVPIGWVIDETGNPLSDPKIILNGFGSDQSALLPLGGVGETNGGHKGYGLSTMVEILSSALQGGAFLFGLSGFDGNKKPTPFRVGHFFLAINIESFIALEEFKKTTGEILRQLRATHKAPGHDRIFTAGEKEFESEKVTRKQGIPINPNLQQDIAYIRDELQLHKYKFPF